MKQRVKSQEAAKITISIQQQQKKDLSYMMSTSTKCKNNCEYMMIGSSS
jgi:hypothetical protein